MSLAKHVSIFFKADTKGFQSGLDKMSKSMTKFGRQTQKLGRSITRNFSVPFALAGGAAVKMAADFDTSLTKIRTLVGASESEVNEFKESVLELSGTTAQAPKDLADGLFFLTSAGLKGANAMETLESVSKGVAIGLGEQTDLAKVAGAAQNAYGQDVLSSSDALDVFGKMVKTGMFESSELAKVLGKEAGFAATLGISFEELGAFISTYTRTTGDATSATVGISGVMIAFTKQTDKGEKALAGINMTYKSLKEMLGEQGLQKTLIHLKDRFAEENIELSEFFSKSQSLKGVLNVLGNQTGEYIDILDDLKKSTGFVNDGFKIVEETVGFKLQKAFNEFKLAMMDLGVALLPVANKVIQFVTTLAQKFKDLGPNTQKTIATLAAGFAATGPLMIGIGMVAGGIGKIGKALKFLSINPYIIAFGGAIAGVVAIMNELKFATIGVKDATKKANGEVEVQLLKYESLVKIAKDERYQLNQRIKAIDDLNKSVKSYNGELDLSNVHLLDHTRLLGLEREELMKVAMQKAAHAEVEKVASELFRINQLLDKGGAGADEWGTGIQKAARKLKKEKLEKELRKLTELITQYSNAQSQLLSPTVFSPTTPTSPTSPTTPTSPTPNGVPQVDLSEPDLGALGAYLDSNFVDVYDLAFGQVQESLMEVDTTFESVFEKASELAVSVAENISSGIGNAFANAIVEGENFGEAMISLFKQMLKQIIAAIVQAAILKAIFQAFPGVEAAMSIAGKVTGITSANDIAFGPSAGRFITGPEGTFSLNPSDSIVAGTNLFGSGQGNNNMTVNGYIDGSSIFLSNTRQTNTVNRLS